MFTHHFHDPFLLLTHALVTGESSALNIVTSINICKSNSKQTTIGNKHTACKWYKEADKNTVPELDYSSLLPLYQS